MTAALTAAAILAAFAPMTGVMPAPLNVTASAAAYEAGTVFYTPINYSDGSLGEITTDLNSALVISANVFVCTVKDDSTISVEFTDAGHYHRFLGMTLTIPETIGGNTVSKVGNSTGEWSGFSHSGCAKDSYSEHGQAHIRFSLCKQLSA